MEVSFQMELEQLISHKAPWSAVLTAIVGTDIPSLHTFLEILSGNRPNTTLMTSTTTYRHA
jgi:hypothetical protein